MNPKERVTPDLAGLLRQAAEKWPEKFKVFGSKQIVFEISDDGSIVYLNELNVPRNFPLDHMDAIAQTLGMWFDVCSDGDKEFWSYRVYQDGSTRHIEPKSQWAGFKSKRSASISALIAILQHKLGEGQ